MTQQHLRRRRGHFRGFCLKETKLWVRVGVETVSVIHHKVLRHLTSGSPEQEQEQPHRTLQKSLRPAGTTGMQFRLCLETNASLNVALLLVLGLRAAAAAAAGPLCDILIELLA